MHLEEDKNNLEGLIHTNSLMFTRIVYYIAYALKDARLLILNNARL